MSIVSFEMVDWNFGWFELEIQTDVIEWRFRWVNVHSKFSNVSQCRLKRVIEYWDKSERLRWVSSDWCESYNSEKNQREWVESVHIEVNECRLMWVIEYWEKSERMRWVSADWGEWVRHKVWADPTHRRAVILDTNGANWIQMGPNCGKISQETKQVLVHITLALVWSDVTTSQSNLIFNLLLSRSDTLAAWWLLITRPHYRGVSIDHKLGQIGPKWDKSENF